MGEMPAAWCRSVITASHHRTAAFRVVTEIL
jgi:hypothetical protein